jgi:hypothetical protein
MALIKLSSVNLDGYNIEELGVRGEAERDLLAFIDSADNEALLVYKAGTVQALKTARDKHNAAVGIKIVGTKKDSTHKVKRGNKSYSVTRNVWASRDYIMLSKTDTNDDSETSMGGTAADVEAVEQFEDQAIRIANDV